MAKDKNYHDMGYKELLQKKRNFIKFMRHFVEKEWVQLIDESSLHLCDKGFVDSFFGELESDLIYRAKISERDVYFFILTELQSSPDFTIPFRLFKYISAILTRVFGDTPEKERERKGFRLPVVVPIVFYNGTKGWYVTRNFKDYLQDSDLFEGVIDFEYTLVDINMLDREYLLKNHDAICAAIAVDKASGGGLEQLHETIIKIAHSKQDFTADEFSDFLTWFKQTAERRVGSAEAAEKAVALIDKGDDEMMRTGLDILFDTAEARGESKGRSEGRSEGFIEAALRLIGKGKSIEEATDLLDLSDEQVEQVKQAKPPSTVAV